MMTSLANSPEAADLGMGHRGPWYEGGVEGGGREQSALEDWSTWTNTFTYDMLHVQMIA